MGYPVILGGDHAEFEQQWAASGKPDSERPDWPLPSFDARDWAAAFCKIATNLGYKDADGKPIDEGWMISWFANALMRGHDEVMGRLGSEHAKPRRYNIATDEMVDVTQEWVHDVQTMFNKFGAARGHARSFLKSSNANPEGTRKAIQDFMDAWKPEFEQKPPA